MESSATDKTVPREITALLSDERLILRETQRAVTPFGGVAVFISFLGKIGFVKAVREHMPIRWRSQNHIESHRSDLHLHSVPDIGAGGSQTLRSCGSAAGRSRVTCAAGPGTVSYRRHHPQSISCVRHGPGPAPLRTAGRMADATFAAARGRLHPGFGFDGV